MKSRSSWLALVGVGALALALGVTALIRGGMPSARADVEARNTALALDTQVFEPDTPAVDAITSLFSSTNSSDDRIVIDTYWCPAGSQVEKRGGSSSDERVSPGDRLGVKWTYPRSEYNSGDTFRVAFTAFDSSGSVTFAASRSVVVP